MVDIGAPFITLAVVILIGSDDDIGAVVAVDISSRAYRVAKLGASLVALGCPIWGNAQAGSRTVVDVDAPFVDLAIVMTVSPDNHIGVAVAVDIPGCAHRVAKPGAGLVALGRPIRSIAWPAD